MMFKYDPQMGRDFPTLVTAFASAEGLPDLLSVEAEIARFTEIGLQRVSQTPEAELPAIRAWRAAFSQMGLKPTQYRCASEALLRRLRKQGSLPRVHPLVDLANAVSVAHAVPVAVFDVARLAGDLTVQPARGDETYRTFAGTDETPEPGEIVFVDARGAAHARRWTNRQSATSAVSPATRHALIVIEALHEAAETDVTDARDALAAVLADHGATVSTGLVRGGAGGFEAGDTPR